MELATVTLYTAGRNEVVAVLLPPFKDPPDVIWWGARFFVWREDEKEYREGFVYHVPPELVAAGRT